MYSMYVIILHRVRSHLLLQVKLTNNYLETYHVFDQEAQA